MPTLHLVPDDLRERYHVKEWRNAAGVLSTACKDEWDDVQAVLRGFRLLKSEVLVGGGNRSLVSQRIDEALYARGWVEKDFATSITVDEVTTDSPTHKVDCFKNGVAVEMEWNNKDPFFDRDLNNFRLLFELRADSGRDHHHPIMGVAGNSSSGSVRVPHTGRPRPITRSFGRSSKAGAAVAARC